MALELPQTKKWKNGGILYFGEV